MAKVWPIYSGRRPTAGSPWVVLPLDDAVHLLELKPQHFLADLSDTPKFGNTEEDFTWVGYQNVIVEVGDDEAKADWKSGFYRSPLAPSDAFHKLLEWRIEQQIGPEWRVKLEEGRDADGDPAMWAWVTLKADAPPGAWERATHQRIDTKVRKAVADGGVSEWVFVRFRDEKEDRATS